MQPLRLFPPCEHIMVCSKMPWCVSAAVKELKVSYHNPETVVFTVYPNYGNLN